MAESIGALVRMTFVSEPDERMADVVGTTLATTRAFDGLEHMRILKSIDRPNEWTLYQVWRDADAEQAYRAFRASPDGAAPALGEIVESITVERFAFQD